MHCITGCSWNVYKWLIPRCKANLNDVKQLWSGVIVWFKIFFFFFPFLLLVWRLEDSNLTSWLREHMFKTVELHETWKCLCLCSVTVLIAINYPQEVNVGILIEMELKSVFEGTRKFKISKAFCWFAITWRIIQYGSLL